jgi:hypothetical protein
MKLDVVFCKKAKDYSLYGVQADSKTNVTLPVNDQSPQVVVPSVLFQSEQDDRRPTIEQSALFGGALHLQESDKNDNHKSSVQADPVVRTATALIQPASATPPQTEFMTKCLSQMCTIDMLLQNFIASVVTFEDCKPTVAQGLLAPIAINTICMTYTQYKLIIDGFIKARAGQVSNDNTHDALLIKHQIQALAGLLSAGETGIRWFFNIMAVVNQPSKLLQYTLASMSGAGKGGSFLMTSGHKACDVPLGKTLIGKLVYSFLTSPVTPDVIQYITVASPAVVGVILSSAVLTIKDELNIENVALSSLIYTVAFFSGIMGFLIQKCYSCDVMRKNVGNNATSVKEWNKFWYGETDNANCIQMASYAVKRFMDILTVLPLTALDIADKLLGVCCYFVLAMLPIQIIAMCQYISQPALTYWVYYQVFHNTQNLIKTYTGKDTSPLDHEVQYLATLVALPFGIASAFTMLNLTGGEILKGTDAVYNARSTDITVPHTGETTLLVQPTSSKDSLYGRLSKVAPLAKSSVTDVVKKMIDNVSGKNGLEHI